MIIGIDAGCLGVTDERLKVGVYQLSLNILKNLAKLDKENKYLLYSFFPIEEKILQQLGKSFTNPVLQPKRGWLSLRLSWELFVNKPDLFLGLGQALPFFHPTKSIVFVYDLAFEHYPSCYKDTNKRLSLQTKYAVRHSDKIIAISNSTKDDLIRFYHINESKIKVIYPGVDPIFTPNKSKKYKLNSPYFLSVGSLKPIKNIPRVIEAFALFLKQKKEKYKLVLAGSDFWLDTKIKEIIKRLKLDKQIIILGFVSREDIPALYSGAKALVSPSLYEGFGLPILEAMACGTPVITSNTGSMPEVAGKAALLVDPFDIKAISQALCKIDKDENLVSQLRKRGLRKIKQYSWEKTAAKLLKLMNNINMDPDVRRDDRRV